MNIHQGALVGSRLGKYELLALLAVGGTAEIYLARIDGEAGFEKYVVVKCLLDHLADESDYVRMFLDEARLGAQLDHSNIVQTLELGEKDGRYFMAMEYLAGMSLAQLARKTNQRVAGGKIPVELVLSMAAQTCAGLHYAHRKPTSSGAALNLVHRDISPQNLVVSFEGILKIVDFGIAKADVRETHTQSGTIKGKFAYMSPEQCLAKKVDFRTDIFALGVILHELLTARRLFKRTTTYETYEAIIKGKVPLPSEVNPELDQAIDDVVMKALEYNKEDRYESAEALGQALLGTLHKRGQLVNASDIARFYQAHFDAEIKEHGDRMRMLITGKKKSAIGEESINWGSDEIDGSPPEEVSEIAIELEGSMIESIESISMGDAVEPLAAVETLPTIDSMDDIISGVTEGSPASSQNLDPDAGHHGATRVEVNPMALLEVQPQRGAAKMAAPGLPGSRPTGMGGQTLVPGGLAPLPSSGRQEGPRGPASGPGDKTIGPGQLTAPRPPAVPARADGGPLGRGRRSSRDRPTVNLGRNPGGAASEAGQPRKTVMGVAAAPPAGPSRPTGPMGPMGSPIGQRASSSPPIQQRASSSPPIEQRASSSPPIQQRASGSPNPPSSSPSARTLYEAPPPNDAAMRGGSAAESALVPAMRPSTSAPSPSGQPPNRPPSHPAHPAGPPPQLSSMHPSGPGGGPGPGYGTSPQQGQLMPGHSTDRVRPYPSNTAPMRRSPRPLPREPWFIGLVFAVALGVGLGVTLLIASF